MSIIKDEGRISVRKKDWRVILFLLMIPLFLYCSSKHVRADEEVDKATEYVNMTLDLNGGTAEYNGKKEGVFQAEFSFDLYLNVLYGTSKEGYECVGWLDKESDIIYTGWELWYDGLFKPGMSLVAQWGYNAEFFYNGERCGFLGVVDGKSIGIEKNPIIGGAEVIKEYKVYDDKNELVGVYYPISSKENSNKRLINYVPKSNITIEVVVSEADDLCDVSVAYGQLKGKVNGVSDGFEMPLYDSDEPKVNRVRSYAKGKKVSLEIKLTNNRLQKVSAYKSASKQWQELKFDYSDYKWITESFEITEDTTFYIETESVITFKADEGFVIPQGSPDKLSEYKPDIKLGDRVGKTPTALKYGYDWLGWKREKDGKEFLGEGALDYYVPEDYEVFVPIWSKNTHFSDVSDSSKYFYVPVYWALDRKVTTGTSETTFSPSAFCTREQFVTFLWRYYGSAEPKKYTTFSDVDSSKYYYKAVMWAAERGITTGYAGTDKFGVGDNCTREQCVTFLYRSVHQPKLDSSDYSKYSFSDVKNGYYVDAVTWAAKRGITQGVNERQFGVREECTRGMLVTFLYRFYNSY